MSELLATEKKKELWFDGPNYTVDAVILNDAKDSILLIERADGGGWALPGGFRDPEDATTEEGARREASEEAGIELAPGVPIFRGIVDDPRNTDRAWIETEAFLYTMPDGQTIQAGDDAIRAEPHRLDDLPSLYASHQAIIERALDYLDQESLLHIYDQADQSVDIDGGHMEYDKSIVSASGDENYLFIKSHNPDRFTDSAKAERSALYLEKESATMSHLRLSGFRAIPDQSLLYENSLILQALRPEDNWHWRAPGELLEPYLVDTLTMFAELEKILLPSDTFPIEASIESFSKEGWADFDEEKQHQLALLFEQFQPRLNEESIATARELIDQIDALRTQARQPHKQAELVLCHHDARQSNIAWHPEHGAKLIDWSWAGLGESGSDATNLLIDLHKSGHDVSALYPAINKNHCLRLIGFWLNHSLWPSPSEDNTVRLQQFVSAVSAYDILRTIT